jgi:hypothetical protein
MKMQGKRGLTRVTKLLYIGRINSVQLDEASWIEGLNAIFETTIVEFASQRTDLPPT